ncbi:MAG: hypothetical protein JWQ43_3460 [Glaciihabitans sp.]|nr:hypothetical protein [Glaciihabitans sp.]
MTLHKDRDPRKRPPMTTRTMYLWIAGAVAVIVFVAIVLAVSGQSFF